MSHAPVRLHEVGFWWSKDPSNWKYPKVETAIDWSWDPNERALVAVYTRNGERHEAYMGWSDCRVCGKENGTTDLTDGVYVWPEGFAHYITQHGVKPPIEFIEHVKRSAFVARR